MSTVQKFLDEDTNTFKPVSQLTWKQVEKSDDNFHEMMILLRFLCAKTSRFTLFELKTFLTVLHHVRSNFRSHESSFNLCRELLSEADKMVWNNYTVFDLFETDGKNKKNSKLADKESVKCSICQHKFPGLVYFDDQSSFEVGDGCACVFEERDVDMVLDECRIILNLDIADKVESRCGKVIVMTAGDGSFFNQGQPYICSSFSLPLGSLVCDLCVARLHKERSLFSLDEIAHMPNCFGLVKNYK